MKTSFSLALLGDAQAEQFCETLSLAGIFGDLTPGCDGWSPAELFRAGEIGVWYDPSDFSTMFQDSAGTTPVTAVEQPVGKILDKSGRGNHASQSDNAKRPVLCSRYNLLKYSEQFDNAAWSKTGTLAFGSGSTTNATIAPDGTLTADLVVEDTTTAQHVVYQSIASPGPATTYSGSVWLKYAGRRYVSLRIDKGELPYAVVDLINGTVVGGSGVTVTLAENGFYRIDSTRTLSAGSQYITIDFMQTSSISSFIYTGDGSSGVYVWGGQVTYGSVAYPYQRIAAATAYDADPTKFKPYLAFDGVDDFLQTAAIDFSGTDKMTVVAGFRKNSDAAARMLLELSATTASNNGSFSLQAPDGAAAATYLFQSKGTALAAAQATSQAAPKTAVTSGIGSIAADSTIIRVNGVQAAASSDDQGTGNYGNHVAYIGARGGTSMFSSAHLYQLIVRGAETPDLTTPETYVNGKTGAY